MPKDRRKNLNPRPLNPEPLKLCGSNCKELTTSPVNPCQTVRVVLPVLCVPLVAWPFYMLLEFHVDASRGFKSRIALSEITVCFGFSRWLRVLWCVCLVLTVMFRPGQLVLRQDALYNLVVPRNTAAALASDKGAALGGPAYSTFCLFLYSVYARDRIRYSLAG